MQTTVPPRKHIASVAFLLSISLSVASASAQDKSGSDGEKGALTVKEQHSDIGIPSAKAPAATHTQHPDAQWFPDAGLGLFLHWSVSSVKAKNISPTSF